MKNSVKESKERKIIFEGGNIRKYLIDIYEENETIQSYITLEDFVELVISNYPTKNEILSKRVLDFEDLVIHENYSHVDHSNNYDEEKDVEINFRKLSFNDIF